MTSIIMLGLKGVLNRICNSVVVRGISTMNLIYQLIGESLQAIEG
jgi:hypothetical protein